MIHGRIAKCSCALLLLVGPASGQETLRQLSERKGVVVGAMILDATWETPQQRSVVAAEFRGATVGTYWVRTHPEPDIYDWSVTDSAVQWADSQGLGVHLHPLLYPADEHNPQWVLNSEPTRANALAILESHITVAMNRYKGVVDVWDVVNEAVSPSSGFRNTWWHRAIGDDYVLEAFRIARREDPNAILLYNEHDIELSNGYQTGKWTTTQQILQSLHAEGLVDGLGWQLHTNPAEVLGNQFVLADRMRWVREELGLMNFVTELDMVIEPGNDALVAQGEAFERVTRVWLKHSGGGWLQTWGVYDGQTWLGSENRPLLLNEQYGKKPAYDGVIDALLTVPDVGPGDFNNDGEVDEADYELWREQFGAVVSPTGLGADGNADGLVDAADYTAWRDNFSPLPVATSVPTPQIFPLAAISFVTCLFSRATDRLSLWPK